MALLALTIGLAMSLVLLTVAMDQAWLRFCLMAALAALGLFLRRTFVIGAFGFVIGLVGTLIMTAPDFVPDPELVVRASLWLWPVFALGIAASVAVNLLIAPSDPATLLRRNCGRGCRRRRMRWHASSGHRRESPRRRRRSQPWSRRGWPGCSRYSAARSSFTRR